jgi:AAA ATPase domain
MSTQGKLTLRNYRCFDWEHPVVLEFDSGFSAFIGPNNSGKSTALRSIYELRQIFVNWYSAFQAGQGFRTNFQPLGTSDLAELANDAAPSRFQIELEIINPQPAPDPSHSVAVKVVLEYDIPQQSLFAKQLVFMSPNGDKNHWGEAEVKLA